MEAPASRNAPCACGSGRRYKECHGALAGPAPASTLNGILDAALAAQRASRIADAIDGYERALALAPDHFDALHMLGVARFQCGDFEEALALVERALVQRPDDEGARFNRALVENALARRPAEAELADDAQAFAAAMQTGGKTGDDAAVRVIAFYLPQFHRIPENDAWWGEGFTEWSNVRKAKPNFRGHAQPHIPGELGYYDLTDPAVREAQAALARAHGVDAFCYYHYWFGGRRLLERPLDDVLRSGKPDFPFCICWANENWTRRWDGRDDDVLMVQRYSPQDAEAFIDSLLPAFGDRRYVRVDGRPLLVVYKLADLPDPRATAAAWRKRCRDAGVGDPYLAAVQRNALDDPTPFGFDAAIEFPPIGHAAENITSRVAEADPSFRGSVFGYANLACDYLLRRRPDFRAFRGVTPMWDNTARRQRDGMIVDGSSPALFGAWATHALRQTRLRHRGESRLLFVNAWNEWAEGNHLEPDAEHGKKYLEALATARGLAAAPPLERPPFAQVERDTQARVREGTIAVERFGSTVSLPAPGVSVVMPVYNHERFVRQALDSIGAQTRLPDEIIAVDDGSTDGSADLIAAWAANARVPVTLVRQRNAGAHVALNRGMAIARGGVIALVNSDDAFAPDRLSRLCNVLADTHALAFSGVSLVDEHGDPARSSYARTLAQRIAEVGRIDDLWHVLVRHNAAVSTGNLVFRRALLHEIGAFAAYRVCHDWDFVLAATLATRPSTIGEPLYVYRLHGANTYAAGTLAGRLESEMVLASFIRRVAVDPRVDDGRRARLFAVLRTVGMSGFVDAA
ncbi:MAG TPA: glycoside hydrolase family 99-like domain-containing protein [Casimicrobiaceae bacterium]|nr:glycoside hydrolase family 99-like domain-containing protein [Casimicrobiaceae bacterium]